METGRRKNKSVMPKNIKLKGRSVLRDTSKQSLGHYLPPINQ